MKKFRTFAPYILEILTVLAVACIFAVTIYAAEIIRSAGSISGNAASYMNMVMLDLPYIIAFISPVAGLIAGVRLRRLGSDDVEVKNSFFEIKLPKHFLIIRWRYIIPMICQTVFCVSSLGYGMYYFDGGYSATISDVAYHAALYLVPVGGSFVLCLIAAAVWNKFAGTRRKIV